MRSPSALARVAGALYLYIFAAGLFAEAFVRSRLVVPDDAAVTAANILANESLFRVGFAGELLHLACDVVIAAILYVLFRPVSRTGALVAALMRVAGAVVLAVASISHFAALRLLSGADYLAALPAGETQALALLALRLHADGYAICLMFFSFSLFSLGWLILRSGLIPKAIGALLVLAGACYLVNSIAGFVAPGFAAMLFPAILVPCAIAELALALWLVTRGVDDSRWRALRAE
ncbi:MAG: DUF4386 domain-containing protein [Steroidobacteraceae bacterium]